jgi:UDP-2,4-diacetamido-2,4,6-trideoxy-beta-L-altropyranose hydrolase
VNARRRTPAEIVVRTDGSRRLGSGHVTRCLTLANELKRRGANVRFLCRELSGDGRGYIERAGFTVSGVGGSGTVADDARACLELLAERPVDWLIVDHYEFDEDWERTLRGGARRILAIDDLARRHDCDAVLDQNWHADRTTGRYAGLVPDDCQQLLGPRFALLQPDYAQLRTAMPPRTPQVNNVLVFFGASDATDETSKALEALSAAEFAHWTVDVVIGADHPNAERVVALVKARPRTRLHRSLPSLAPLMKCADLALGAGGTTTWERLCLGVPSLVTTLADNQEAVTTPLASAGYVRWIGSAPGTSSKAYMSALRAPPVAAHLEPLVDGFGTKRVAEHLMPSPIEALKLRPVRAEDAMQLFAWRQDPVVRAMSFDGPVNDWRSHLTWFDRKIADATSRIFIAEVDGLPVGQIRFDREADEAVLSYSLDHLVRGRGFSAWLVSAGLRAIAPTSARVRALVKQENAVSRRVFEKLGWIATAAEGHVVFQSAKDSEHVD